MRRLQRSGIGLLLTLATVLAGVFVAVSPASAALPNEGTYVIRALNSGRCLDVVAGSTANGARVQQWDCNGGLQQAWLLDSLSVGYFRLINVKSGKCMDIRNVSTADGAWVQQWDCNGGNQQRFSANTTDGGRSIRIRASHSGKCLDVTGGPGATGNGVKIQQWTCFSSAPTNQRFY